jgi:hypothetical protein
MLVVIYFSFHTLWAPDWYLLSITRKFLLKKEWWAKHRVHALKPGVSWNKPNNESKGGQGANVTDPLPACCMLVCMDLCRKTIAKYHRIMGPMLKVKAPSQFSMCLISRVQWVLTKGLHYENLPETLYKYHGILITAQHWLLVIT